MSAYLVVANEQQQKQQKNTHKNANAIATREKNKRKTCNQFAWINWIWNVNYEVLG